MTIIIASRDEHGDILLAADTRVTWPLGASGPSRHVDTLQKLYLPFPNVVFLFASNNLLEMQKVLREVTDTANKTMREKFDEDPPYTLVRRLDRLFHKKLATLTARAALLIALACPHNPIHTRLYLVRVGGPGDRVRWSEVLPGDLVVEGLIQPEHDADRLRELLQTRIVLTQSCDILDRASVLYDAYFGWAASRGSASCTVGEVLTIALSREGVIRCVPVGARRIESEAGTVYNVSVCFDDRARKFAMRNELTGEEIALVGIDTYDLMQAPTMDNMFRIIDPA